MNWCFECGAEAEHDHHVVPRSLGGTQTVPLCLRCHGLVHGKRMAHASLTREALAARKALRKRVGSVPWGYKLVGGVLEVNEREREAANIARAMRYKGHSLRDIGLCLSDMGYYSRSGGILKAQSVSRLCLAPA